MKRFLVIFLTIATLAFSACSSQKTDYQANNTSTPTIFPIVTTSPNEFMLSSENLAGTSWKDIYDDNFTITFDSTGTKFTEKNSLDNSSNEFKIVENIAEDGKITYSLSGYENSYIKYENKNLIVFYDENIGELEYSKLK